MSVLLCEKYLYQFLLYWDMEKIKVYDLFLVEYLFIYFFKMFEEKSN